jgi:hypothetical protein
LTIILSAFRFPINANTLDSPISTVFASLSDTSILCGLLITVGGVLILTGNVTLGAVTSIIFGFFPPAQQATYHGYDLIVGLGPQIPYQLIALAVGCLPIVGGLLALASMRRLRL